MIEFGLIFNILITIQLSTVKAILTKFKLIGVFASGTEWLYHVFNKSFKSDSYAK